MRAMNFYACIFVELQYYNKFLYQILDKVNIIL